MERQQNQKNSEQKDQQTNRIEREPNHRNSKNKNKQTNKHTHKMDGKRKTIKKWY